MADGRKRSAAKQTRREARRRKARRGRVAEPVLLEEAPLVDEVREALNGGQPMDLLGLVSMLIMATVPPPALLRPPETEDPPSLDELVSAFIDVRVPETTALLAVLSQFVIDDDELRDRCRHEVDARGEGLPPWLAGLAQTSVHQVMRMSHVLGDGEELLLGVRLADGQELTCAVFIDHLEMSEVKDAFFVPETIDTVVAVAKASNTDPDTSFAECDPADARVRLQDALAQQLTMPLFEESDTWPSSRPLVQWLIRLMPLDSSPIHVSQRDSVQPGALLDRFFTSPMGVPFDDVHHRELLELGIDEGTGDPLRWSAARLRQLLSMAVAHHDDIPLAQQLDLPELLRSFVPFAHAESGIRQELTAEALAAIDHVADDYRAIVVEEAERLDED
ncbi:hypothetical protein [Mycolicibacterium hodleri]|uniref:hypothetical protein n=1 Tax=Mycolicibacterium hodleri TaxID=49897 RepID=UPI001877F94E|nr:hypothetical protein [Mycolicibacterium hodleri]